VEFSYDLGYLGLLINGPSNAVYIYECKGSRGTPVATNFFETHGKIDNSLSPDSDDMSRKNAYNRTNTSAQKV
jgi:hypothetical protein